MSEVRVVSYDPRFAADFASLNYQWIEAFFSIEEEDRRALDDPQGYALDSGGQIFFVLEGERAVGTVAMVPYKGAAYGSARVFELAKMAVAPECRGRGHSHLLMQACIQFARNKHADDIMLVTNDSLVPALGLYTSVGFEPVLQKSDERYMRGNLEMHLRLGAKHPD